MKTLIVKSILSKSIDAYLPGWKWKFHRSGKAYGYCYHDDKKITLNIEHVRRDSDKEIIDTIAHELAHGICGYELKHSKKWKHTYMLIFNQLYINKDL